MTKSVDELMRLFDAIAEAERDGRHRLAGDRRTALRSALEEVVKDAERALPKDPPAGLLMSMAIRYDHGLSIPGYYDRMPGAFLATSHAKKLEDTLRTMRQLYEEVSGHGFYTPAAEARYAAMQQAPEQEG